MAHSLQARVDLIRQALQQADHTPGSPAEAALAETRLLNRDIQATDTALANAILELTQERAAVHLLTQQKSDATRNHQRDLDQLEAELAACRETITELRVGHERKIGEISVIVRDYHQTLDALSQTLREHL